jgi:hypothetical protein
MKAEGYDHEFEFYLNKKAAEALEKRSIRTRKMDPSKWDFVYPRVRVPWLKDNVIIYLYYCALI